jgi:hypothetical protein
MWAITTFGTGKPVTARAIEPDWNLVEGEEFKVDVWEPGMIWDGNNVRHLSANELSEAEINSVWEEIKAERDQRKAGGVMIAVDGVDRWFHTDDPSRIQYSILDNKATRGALPDETVLHPLWKTMSGVKVPMTVGRLREILDAGIVLEATVFNVAEAHRAAMQESENPAEYDYSGNWPQTYADWAALQ